MSATPAPTPQFSRSKSVLYASIIVVAFFALVEGLLRLAGVENPMQPQILLRRIDVDITFPFMQADKNLMWAPRPGFTGEFQDKTVSINALGLRGPKPATPKPAGRQRVICFGDSITFGYGVSDEGTYPARLEATLARHDVDVVNAGVTGYTSHQVLRLAERTLPLVQADVATFCIGWNDATRRPVHDREYGQRLQQTMTVDLLLDHSRIYSLLKGTYQRWRTDRLKPTQDVQRVPLDHYAENLAALVVLSQRHGARPVFIALPHRRGGPRDDRIDWTYADAFEAAAQRENVPVLEVGVLGQQSESNDTQAYFIDALHFSEDGNRLMAETLATQLIDTGLLCPCGD